ncbi:alkaline phosphatase PhoX [Euzebya rosea]|uniref:alkaline phosphatase PhoX n=1 Tax=Euzebya rosea TaxID=2052804 RepID=UPI00196B5A1D|nr:alkaline phosphatase PhoX [Euzebya rosea]
MHIGQTALRRRTLLKATVLGAVLACSPAQYRTLLAGPVVRGEGPYGALLGPDANGLMLPKGFRSRIIAASGLRVGLADGASSYVWHPAPDGAACFPEDDGGWRYVNNSEVGEGAGGVGGIRFAADGSTIDAYPVLQGTSRNCAGGITPWGTWLSCEEAGDSGQVWECPPDGSWAGEPHPMLGRFNHEAVAVDPVNQHLFLTEDDPAGLFYRWVMAEGRFDEAMAEGRMRARDEGDGVLQAAVLADDGSVEWVDVDDPTATPLRERTAGTAFNGGEGIWYDSGFVYFTTKGDNRVWVHDVEAQTITTLYHAETDPDGGLTGVDNVTVAPSGDVLVAEDGGDMEIRLITADTREVVPLVRMPGPEHEGSEVTGPCFSPDGSRLYFSSQRAGLDGPGDGLTYEVTGPFRTQRVGIAATTTHI